MSSDSPHTILAASKLTSIDLTYQCTATNARRKFFPPSQASETVQHLLSWAQAAYEG
ncbi:hypothetical protein PIB30_097810, partial [Stylosanthes scabra]|nr:hypothetical protein [Stylosanthes scabra]